MGNKYVNCWGIVYEIISFSCFYLFFKIVLKNNYINMKNNER